MDKALQTMIDNMPAKTGKSLEEWKKILSTKGFAKHSEGVKYLKAEHKVTHGFANTIVTLSKAENHSPDDLVSGQYKGKEKFISYLRSTHKTRKNPWLRPNDYAKKRKCKYYQKKTILINKTCYQDQD